MKAATVRSMGDDSDDMIFQSTPPVKAATCNASRVLPTIIISIHAAREGGDDSVQVRKFAHVISIHAAREGGDAAFECSFIA